MKKALGGCLAIGLVLMIGGGVVGWFVVVKPMWEAGSELIAAGQQWMKVAELDEQVRNTSPFSPPPDDRLDASLVDRFIAVQGAIEQALGGDWKLLEEKFERLDQGADADGREPTLQELFGGFNELSAIVLVAKQAQVDALNARNMSLEEYRYLRMHGYMAAGIALQDETPLQLEGSVAAHNAELLRPYREILLRTLSTTWLGF
jgi:hypothetical protein